MPPPAPLRPIARRALAAQSDERLVKLVREGHEPAFEEMVRRYRGPLVAFASAIVSADGAEDVVQSSLEKANRAMLADSREITLRPWLFAIVRNCALNAIRREPRVDELNEAMATSAGPSEIAEQREDLDRLVVAMCALPVAQRQALVKRELEGVGHGEIAAQLGTTATAVRGLIFRARTGLRDAAGAVVPLPIVRTLLMEAPAPAIGLAGGGAGMGAAAMLGGGGAAKGGTAIAAAVIALGTGIAIDHGRKDNGDREGSRAATVRSVANGPEVARASGSSRGGDAPPPAVESSGGGGGSSSSGPGGSSSSGPSAGGGGGGESGDDDVAVSVSADDSGGNSSGGSDNSGKGSGSSGEGSGGAEVEEADEDNSGPGSGSSGHGGGGGGGNSGPGGSGHDDDDELEVEEEDDEEIEEIDDVDDGDNSGSGSGGSSGPGSGTTTTPDDPLDEERLYGDDSESSDSDEDEPNPAYD